MENTIRRKAEAALGLHEQSAFDIVKRSDYQTEAEYIQALAATSKAMETPEYRRAAAKAREAEQREREREIRAQQRKEYKEILSAVKLTEAEKKDIDQRAADKARADLAAGKFGASELGKNIQLYADEMAAAAKAKHATSQQFNAMLRGAYSDSEKD